MMAEVGYRLATALGRQVVRLLSNSRVHPSQLECKARSRHACGSISKVRGQILSEAKSRIHSRRVLRLQALSLGSVPDY